MLTNPGDIAPSRPELADELLIELTSWRPRDWLHAFQRWQRGSLSLVHLNVIAVLEQSGPRSMSQLAEALDVSVASMTGIVSRMERRRLVTRRHDTTDRRIVVVHLSRTGEKVFERVELHRRDRLAVLLKELDEEQLAGFLIGLRALRAARTRVVEREAEGEGPSKAEPAR